jgi:prephenate dehydratase
VEQYQLHIVGEFEHQDHHTLVGLPGCKLDDIEEVLVHPFSLAQIHPLPQILDGKRIIIADETAKAIAEGQSKKRAAISSTRAATIYDLYTFDEFEVIGVTRYILVSKKEASPERYLSPRTTLKLSMKNQVGALMKTTCAFAHRNLKYIIIN